MEGFVEFGVGYDTNVNAATANSQVAIPAFGIITSLDPNATKRHDSFGALSGGLAVTHKLTEAWSVVGNALGSLRMYGNATDFDQTLVDANLGARWTRGKEAITVGGQLQSFGLDWALATRRRLAA